MPMTLKIKSDKQICSKSDLTATLFEETLITKSMSDGKNEKTNFFIYLIVNAIDNHRFHS